RTGRRGSPISARSLAGNSGGSQACREEARGEHGDDRAGRGGSARGAVAGARRRAPPPGSRSGTDRSEGLTMRDTTRFYIDGAWVAPASAGELGVFNPATEEEIARIGLGSAEDVERAARAARRAFAAYSHTSREERLGYLHRIVAGFRRRLPDLARTMSEE